MANKKQREIYNSNEELLKVEEKSARYFKAVFEKMYYSLEIEKLKTDYLSFLQSNHPEVLENKPASSEEEVPETTTDGDIKE